MYSYVTHMSFVCNSYVSYITPISMSIICVVVCHSYVTCMYSYVIRMSLVCTRMLFVCHSYVLICHPYVTRMYSYVTRMSLACTHMSPYVTYVLICHPYVTRMYSYVTVCHSYVLICHPYVTRMWSYHEPWISHFYLVILVNSQLVFLSFCIF